jgi:hypothetical protein
MKTFCEGCWCQDAISAHGRAEFRFCRNSILSA